MKKILIIVILPFLAGFALVAVITAPHNEDEKPKYTIACGLSAETQVRICIEVETTVSCAVRKRKEVLQNNIYTHCIEHKI